MMKIACGIIFLLSFLRLRQPDIIELLSERYDQSDIKHVSRVRRVILFGQTESEAIIRRKTIHLFGVRPPAIQASFVSCKKSNDKKKNHTFIVAPSHTSTLGKKLSRPLQQAWSRKKIVLRKSVSRCASTIEIFSG